jgi:hypothetical protein
VTHQVIADGRHAAEHSKEVFRKAGEAWPDDRLKEITPDDQAHPQTRLQNSGVYC